MKQLQFVLGAAAMAASASSFAQIGLLGVTQTYPDVNLSSTSNYLIWDNTGYDTNTGKLRLVTKGTTLTEAAGGDDDSQTYGSFMLVIEANIERRTQGTAVQGRFVSGTVSIAAGPATPGVQPQWSWTGTLNDFGIASDGKSYDASWTLNADTYLNMPADMLDNPLYPNEFTNGWLAGHTGGIKINTNNIGFANLGCATLDGCLKSNDWIMGTGLNDTNTNSTTAGTIGAYLTTLGSTYNKTGDYWFNTTVSADVFVTPPPVAPVPEMNTIGLMALGMTALFPLVRRRRQA